MSYIDASVAATIRWEGMVSWMYLDTIGIVTVGCGLALADTGVACSLPFQLQDGGLASEDVVVTDFHRVKALAPGKRPGFYHSLASPVLSQSDIKGLLRKRVVADDAILRTGLASWDAMPAAAKLALLDMDYNLGTGGLFRHHLPLIESVRAGNWTAAASQCHRIGISDDRNDWTKKLFLTAAQVS
jgi:GH24 family phage-related lysozyme (muramidase)